MIKFLNYLENEKKQKGFNKDYEKFSTHPIYEKRYNIIKESENNKKKNFDKNINKNFNFIRAKFFGYTEKDINFDKKLLGKDYYTYANSIILSKNGRLKESLKILNNLIKDEKNYIYLIETKADILYSHGFFKESLLFYNKVLNIDDKNYYVTRRIFDIKYVLKEKNFKSRELFDDFKSLLEIYNDRNLNYKFKELAITNNNINWIIYFDTKENFDNQRINEINKKEIIMILNNSHDKTLIKLIKKLVKNIDDKI